MKQIISVISHIANTALETISKAVFAIEVYIYHMWPQAFSVWRHCVSVCVCLCACGKPSLYCRSSMSGCSVQCCRLLYNCADYSNKDNLLSSYWHTFFLLSLPSICLPILRAPHLGYFHLTRLNALLNALFPSVSSNYLAFLLISLLSLFMSFWLQPKIPSYYSLFLYLYIFSVPCPLYQSPSIPSLSLFHWDLTQVLQMLFLIG